MICLLTMIRQQHYMATSNYGFRTKGVLTIPLNDIPYQRLANELKSVAGVESGISLIGHAG